MACTEQKNHTHVKKDDLMSMPVNEFHSAQDNVHTFHVVFVKNFQVTTNFVVSFMGQVMFLSWLLIVFGNNIGAHKLGSLFYGVGSGTL